MPFLAPLAVTLLVFFGINHYLPEPYATEPTLGNFPAFYPDTDGPHYVVPISDGCAEWVSDVLTTTGAECGTGEGASGFSTTSAIYFVNASTTIPKTYTNNTFTLHNIFSSLFATSASSTNATTTNHDITGLFTFGGITGDDLTDFCEAITGSADLCDGDDATGAGGGDYPFTPTTHFGTTTSATSTPLWLRGNQYSLFASSTSIFDNVQFKNATSSYADITSYLKLGGSLEMNGFIINTLIGGALRVDGNTVDVDCSNIVGASLGCSGEDLILNLGNANTWTALQTFGNASSTLFSNFGTAYFGGTATSTFSTAGLLTLVAGTHDFSSATIKQHTYASFTISTTTAWAGTTTIPLGPAYTAEAFNGVKCNTNTGTLFVQFSDGTNHMNDFQASTTVGTVSLSSNNTYTAAEKREVRIGTPASSPTSISCTVDKTVNN